MKDSTMTAATGFVVEAGGGKHFNSPTPGRFFDLKLLGGETGESIMMFEETLPAGTASLYHLHRGSDEIAWVLAGEITFKIGDEVTVGGAGTCAFMPRDVPHAWKNTGGEPGRVLFLYTPAAAGGYIEEMAERSGGPMSAAERDEFCKRYRWEILGPNPL
jgi:quercetin dioxygenase-like cupin family protein